MSENQEKSEALQFAQSPSKEKQELLQSRIVSSQFGNMVTVMMQSQHHKDVRLSELHHRLVPPLLLNQFRVAEARKKDSGTTVPVALIVWAQVSDEVHERMLQQLDTTFELAPKEWRSGDNYWIIDAVGTDRFLAPVLSELRATAFKGKTVNYRAKSPDGPVVRTLSEADQSSQNDNADAAVDTSVQDAPPPAKETMNGQQAVH